VTLRSRSTRNTDQFLPLEVTSTSVDEDGDEEYAIEVRDRSGSADDSTPEEAHSPVGNVVLVM